MALMRIGLAFRAFHPNQPRVPAGHPDGGQWISGDGRHVTISDDEARLIFVSDNDDDRYKVDLRTEEGRGGHTVGRHIGKSDDELFARLEKMRVRRLFLSGGERRNGSFVNLESANDFVNETITANKVAVDDVISGAKYDAWLKKYFGRVTGREAYSTTDGVLYIRNTNGVGVFIIHDPNSKRGFRVQTAYPLTEGD